MLSHHDDDEEEEEGNKNILLKRSTSLPVIARRPRKNPVPPSPKDIAIRHIRKSSRREAEDYYTNEKRHNLGRVQIITYNRTPVLEEDCLNGGGGGGNTRQRHLYLVNADGGEEVFYNAPLIIETINMTSQMLGDLQEILHESKINIDTCLDKSKKPVSPHNQLLSQINRQHGPKLSVTEEEVRSEDREAVQSTYYTSPPTETAATTTTTKRETYSYTKKEYLKDLETRQSLRECDAILLDRRITNAFVIDRKIYVNLHAFTLVNDRFNYCIKTASNINIRKAPSRHGLIPQTPYPYERSKVSHKPVLISKKELLHDMTRHEPYYEEVLAITKHLKKANFSYSIYKRAVDFCGSMIDDENIHMLQKLFGVKKSGFYYAIIVNFGLTDFREIHNRFFAIDNGTGDSADSTTSVKLRSDTLAVVEEIK